MRNVVRTQNGKLVQPEAADSQDIKLLHRISPTTPARTLEPIIRRQSLGPHSSRLGRARVRSSHLFTGCDLAHRPEYKCRGPPRPVTAVAHKRPVIETGIREAAVVHEVEEIREEAAADLAPPRPEDAVVVRLLPVERATEHRLRPPRLYRGSRCCDAPGHRLPMASTAVPHLSI